MSCASTFSHSLIPRYRMVTAQFEQFERHQQTGHEPTRNHTLPLAMSRYTPAASIDGHLGSHLYPSPVSGKHHRIGGVGQHQASSEPHPPVIVLLLGSRVERTRREAVD
jgi:hypothetical protein